MGIRLAKNLMPESSAEYEISSPNRRRYINHYVPLHKAALKGDWEAADKILLEDSSLIRARITEGGETALHIAAVEGHAYFVNKLLERMDASDLKMGNERGSTALCFAAAGGHVDIAKRMVGMNSMLPTIYGREKTLQEFSGLEMEFSISKDSRSERFSPLYVAALQGHNEMAKYLFPLSDFPSWDLKDQAELLTTSIHSGLYDLAVIIVKQYRTLAVAEDKNDETPLLVLASKPLAFCGTNRKGFWGNIIGTMLSYAKLKARNTAAPCNAYTLLDCLWNNVMCQEDIENGGLSENISKLLFVAAESGNDEFLVELIRRYPDSVYKRNISKHSIFHIAVLHRYVEVFNLIYELRGVKDLIASYVDEDDNNILHLAAKKAPQYQLNGIPGAALQMQREVLWYKEVEKIVHPSHRIMKNSANKTPYDLFLEEHKDLMLEGEKQMKQIAKSCMLVAVLIITVVYNTAFTIPGGYDKFGAPILQHKKLFIVFPISEAVAILASFVSMLMFLSILTSRYSDRDFLRSLPLWLVVGVAMLFVSTMAMMVVFCLCLLFYEHGVIAVTMLLVFFIGVPIIFLIMKHPLLVTIVCCTYGQKWLFGCKNRLFY